MSTDEAALEHGDRFSRARLRSNSYDQAIAIDDDQPTRPVPKNPPSGRKASELMYQDDDIHLIKWIEFHHGRLPILLQNINGPCPLLAVANVLLLTQRVNHLHGCWLSLLSTKRCPPIDSTQSQRQCDQCRSYGRRYRRLHPSNEANGKNSVRRHIHLHSLSHPELIQRTSSDVRD